MASPRKGVSPLIATIILIAFTLVVAGLVAGWVTQFATQQRETFSQCAEARLLIRGGVFNPSTSGLSLTVDNYGKQDLGFKVLLENKDGTITTPTPIYNLTKGFIQSFSIAGVSGNLKMVSIRSEQCPGAQDTLSAVYIKGLGVL